MTTSSSKATEAPVPPQMTNKEQEEQIEDEIRTATAFISTSGPCRGIGDVYLTCVATAGLGMCRSLRAQFEQCTASSQATSREMLQELGAELCRHMTQSNNNNDNERLLCAANLVNEQLMQGYSVSSTSASSQYQP
jgi:uncharacterized protein HemX